MSNGLQHSKRRPMKRRGAGTKLAKRAKPSRKIGRPLAKVDEARVYELAYKGLSNRMIAVLVGINHKTLARRFAPELAFWRAKLAEHIRERQWDILNGAAGPAGTVKMAIWLGKNELGQSEKPAVEQPGGPTVKVNITAYKPPDNPARHVDAKRVEPKMIEGNVIEHPSSEQPAPEQSSAQDRPAFCDTPTGAQPEPEQPLAPGPSAPLRSYPPANDSRLPCVY